MNTYIQVFKNKSKHSRLFLIIFSVFILYGAIGLVMSFVFNKTLTPSLNEGSYIVFFFNGIISFWLVRDSMRKEKYFVAWNDSEIQYLLPKSDKTELIKIESITSVKTSRNEIVISLDDNTTKHFNLNYFFFPERTTIKEFFEEISESISDKPLNDLVRR